MLDISRLALLLVLCGSSLGMWAISPSAHAQQVTPRVLDDFDADVPEGIPGKWKYVAKNGTVMPIGQVLEEGERIYVVDEGRRQFLRLYTKNEALRISMTNGDDFDWDLKKHPRLTWQWRANELPVGASERDDNDVGGAVYVTFDTDWLGRPKSIKYTYSSTLPTTTGASSATSQAIGPCPSRCGATRTRPARRPRWTSTT